MRQSDTIQHRDISPLDTMGWLSLQSDGFKDWAARSGRWRQFSAGEALYHADDPPDGLYGLGRGVLEISFPLDGHGPVVVHRAEPGFWIGEAAFLARQTRMVGVTCVAKSLIYHLPTFAIARRLSEDPEAWRAFYQQSHHNTGIAIRALAETLTLSPQARFARMLLRIADENGEIAGSQESLGRVVGLHGSRLKRIVASLVASGGIASGYGKLSIRDRSVLESVGDQD